VHSITGNTVLFFSVWFEKSMHVTLIIVQSLLFQSCAKCQDRVWTKSVCVCVFVYLSLCLHVRSSFTKSVCPSCWLYLSPCFTECFVLLLLISGNVRLKNKYQTNVLVCSYNILPQCLMLNTNNCDRLYHDIQFEWNTTGWHWVLFD